MRLRYIVAKELKCVKEDPSFNFVTILSPLLFLFAFSLMLSGGITLPVQVYPDAATSELLASVENYRAPDGTPYFELQTASSSTPPTNADSNLLVVAQEPVEADGVITGSVYHYLNDVNENMTKNFRNRLNGALLVYIDSLRPEGAVQVLETTQYTHDIPWATGFGASIFVFGLVLSGLLYGMLSMTGEWENKTTVLLKLSPHPPMIPVVGKMLANMVKCFLSGAVFLLVFYLISAALPLHVIVLAGVLFLVYGIFICLGMCLGIVIQSTLTAFLISLATALTLWVGGGGFGPLAYFGTVANALGRINPVTYAIDMVRWCYFNGTTNLSGGFFFLSFAFLFSFVLIVVRYGKWARSEEVR